jgi:hypothetical protein
MTAAAPARTSRKGIDATARVAIGCATTAGNSASIGEGVAGSLADPIARVNRAIHHYHTLKKHFHGVDYKNWSVSPKQYRQGREYRFYVGKVDPLEPVWPLILGEGYHNLRAALDNLVFQLHVRRYRGKVPDAVTKVSAFPAFDCQPTVKHGAPRPPRDWDKIGTLGRAERALIERLQPYKGWGTSYPPDTPMGAMRRAIFDIDRLDIIDKHRHLHLPNIVVQAVPTPPSRIARRYGFEQRPRFGVPLESYAEVDRWTFRTAPPAEDVPMKSYISSCIAIDPRIGPGGGQIAALPHFGGSIHALVMILRLFEGRFPAAEWPDLSSVKGSSG